MATPIGAVLDFAGPQAPPGWLICDGRAVSRTTYSALFAIIGGYWGAGDGSTTFNLPNPNGRASVGPGTNTDQGGHSYGYTFAQQNVGYVWNTITQAHLPNYLFYTDVQGLHSHNGATTNAGTHYHTTDAQGNHNHGADAPGGVPTTPAGSHTHSADVQGNHSHSVFAYQADVGPGTKYQGGGFVGQNQSIGTDVQGAHGHNISAVGDHQHYLYWDGNHSHTTTWVGDHAHGIAADGSHQHALYLNGGGQMFPVINPVIVFTKIIHAGQQAVVRATTDAVAVTAEQDELAELREQIEQLRSLVFARRPIRHLSAPSRGMH